MPLKNSGIDWDIDVGEEQNLVIFNDDNPFYKLLITEFVELKTVLINEKKAKQFTFKCKDFADGIEKDWNITSKRLLRELHKHEPLIGRGLEVRKTGSGFNTHYEVKAIKKVKED